MASARIRWLVALFLASGAGLAQAAEAAPTRITATQPAAVQADPSRFEATRLQALETEQAQIWGLTVAEIQRARALTQPGSARAVFSAPTPLSPVEVLGIHAASQAERGRYAEIYAKALHADTERVLAWMTTVAMIYARLYPDEPALDFKGRKLPRSAIGR